ncbi:GLUG motif-containing protein [Aliarcobacter cryaerophilus]|uniref:GLUG motif-containing protein n=1 Tax=Arcobacter sp. AZ-2023 TaxID=3074453 RepID=A0AA96DT19_9BACT|nr:GLUG motif-containing protein [Arcobacter sp. AZ-2023]
MNFIPSYKNSFRILKGGKISLVVSSFLATTTLTFAAPSGGVVTSGSANISQNGKVTNITQSTQKASINWNKFNIASDETVNFKQPNSSSITLNRVIGNEKSIINGALNSNGQVWIINSNGVLFGKGASINTSGLLATTKDISDLDFQAGNYKFTGNSNESVINLGTIDVVNNGSVILAANEVKNEGTIKAIRGKIHLAGADEYTVNLNGNSLINLIVNKGVLDALVKNSGTIIANGGEVYLTTNAVNELLKGVVNNTGIIEANSLAGITGYVELFAHGGTANVAGTINATDGFVETSGDKVKIDDSFKVVADKWLIDPTDFTIAASGGDMTGATLSNNLASANVEIQSVNGAKGTKGDINVNDTITWSSDKKLTLNAQNDIFINKEITSSHANGKLELLYGQKAVAVGNTSDYHVNAKVNLKAGQNFITKKGSDGTVTNWTVVTTKETMQDMPTYNEDARFVLGTDLTLSGTNNWTAIRGFKGQFDGLGHTITGLHIDKASTNFQGLFGEIENATIKNIGLVNASVSGKTLVGALVGSAINSTIHNTYATGGSVTGNSSVGGLVGRNLANNMMASISSSYSTNSVTGNRDVGGLVGTNIADAMMDPATASITNSYATGSVNGVVVYGNNPSSIGGLVGTNIANAMMMDPATASITNSYASNSVTSTGSDVGGLVGKVEENDGISTITSSFYDNQTNTATMQDSVAFGKTKAEILDAFSGKEAWLVGGARDEGYTLIELTLPALKTFNTSVTTLFAGGFGTANDAYTITNWTQLQNINYAWFTKNKNYKLLNNISSTTAGYIGTGEGWNPIGAFSGNFDGLGHSISDLYINRAANMQGLFGQTEDANIVNLNLINVNITGNDAAGALVGSATTTHIENVSSSGKVVGEEEVGGLVGYMTDSAITVLKSHSSAEVTGIENVGGLVGQLDNSTIRESYSTGKVTGIGTSKNIGGLVGRSSYSTIENSYATGKITGTNNIGGLVGRNTSSSLTNSFWDTQTSGQATSAVGVGKTTAQMQDKSTFDGWDIQEDSTIDKGTPFLAWQKSGNGYTKTWVIGTKAATPPTPNPVDPKPQDTNKGVERIVRSIANQTATTVNLPNMETSTTPNNSGRNTNISFSQGENQMLVSRPIEGQSTQRVSLSEAKQMQIQNGGSGEEVIVPLSNSSIIQLVDGGVNLPSGVEQEFYLANANTQEGK